jgi:glycosyltransferase involved in cell wall biosynthesis
VDVSVVIPTYYRNEALRRAVDSALRAGAAEVIVVDDSGEGHARPAVADLPVEYVALEENRGGNPARQAGIERATGDAVQLLDDDDRLHPAKLDRQCPQLGGGIGVSYTGMEFEGADPRLPAPGARGDVLRRALAFDLSPCVTSTMLIDRELLVDLLPLADRPGADDLGLMIRLARHTGFEFVDEVLVTRGVETDSRGASMGVVEGRRAILEEFAGLYDRYPAARRRAAADTARLAGEIRLREGDRQAALGELWTAFRTAPSPARLAVLVGALGGWRGYRLGEHAAARLP